jgi:arsenate reductase
MSEAVAIYHNNRCSKSRGAMDLLREKDIEPVVVDYLKDPPTVEELRALALKLGVTPHDMVRTKESAYREAGLSPDSSDEEVLKTIAAHPILLERPIVVTEKGARIGRPPERVLEVL